MLKEKRNVLWLIILLVLSYTLIFIWKTQDSPANDVVTDVARLMPTKIHKMVEGNETESIKETILEAKKENLKVSIAGKRHSQGGHTYYRDGLVLDMTGYNKVLEVDPVRKTVRVQSGATWDDIQKAINPYGLSVKVMQSQNIFTIGGSLSVNVHGRDIRNGSLIETVNWFRLLKPDGDIITVSREGNAEYFPLVIGGYGLFGVILDAELQLTSDELYMMNVEEMRYDEYKDYFLKNVLGKGDVKMHLARLSTAPDSFLEDMYVTDYVLDENQEELASSAQLKEDRLTFLTKFLLGVSRDFDWGKNAFWNMQKEFFQKREGMLETRNNVMRSESAFLEYEGENDTDILQEYFIPVEEYDAYIDELRAYLSHQDLNLMNITVRYVPRNEEALMSYAKDDMFALVLLINQGRSEDDIERTGETIRGMIDLTIDHGGSYYLPYYEYPTVDQMHAAYPNGDEFFNWKKELDPDEVFMNFFYERYGQ
ncbi:FAD-binding oxidoreductase [Bacillus sp. KH172YL63]|uniref:FAD-binding oxidoreductase n=1 Tax=Bacillus sp. KH172YL63 TaxID=2709784 RepID=UPI0013E4CEC2|nr:FAD-binding oxidoreductase [Bacillus sp. KH172YL63]BCB03478.1 putative FAD-linked oxidoreductase YitY [Bacillus sp. KH172YL63]